MFGVALVFGLPRLGAEGALHIRLPASISGPATELAFASVCPSIALMLNCCVGRFVLDSCITSRAAHIKETLKLDERHDGQGQIDEGVIRGPDL